MPDVSHVKLFRDLSAKELQRIGTQFRETAHPAGAEIITAGEGGVGFMVILDGEVEVRMPDGRTRQLKRGDHFGEIALLNEDSRSATIVTRTDVKLAGITGWDFKPFLLEHPEVMFRLLQNLSRFVREAEAN
jgi:CRP-like cAMP-binding protein